jgi:FdhD protein
MNNKAMFPEIADAGQAFSRPALAVDELGKTREIELAGERALTIYVDNQEIVTLMTMGTHPEMLTLGYSNRHCPLRSNGPIPYWGTL